MKKIQVIGLPCSGKTTAINSYKLKNKNFRYIDIRSYSGPDRFIRYKKEILKSSTDVVAESASGVAIPGTYVIRLDISKRVLYARTLERESELDEYYLSLLEKDMIKPQYTAESAEALHAILDALFLRADKDGILL